MENDSISDLYRNFLPFLENSLSHLLQLKLMLHFNKPPWRFHILLSQLS